MFPPSTQEDWRSQNLLPPCLTPQGFEFQFGYELGFGFGLRLGFDFQFTFDLGFGFGPGLGLRFEFAGN